MPDSPKSFRLPESVIGTGDPLGSNPFPPSDPRHDVWTELTRDAEEEVCQIDVQVLARPKSFDELLDLDAHNLLLNHQVAKFDVWAKRTVTVVLTDDLVAEYDRWLLDYANAWLEEVARFLDNSPPPFSVEDALCEARIRFGGRVQYWRGVARRGLRNQTKATRSLRRRRCGGVKWVVGPCCASLCRSDFGGRPTRELLGEGRSR